MDFAQEQRPAEWLLIQNLSFAKARCSRKKKFYVSGSEKEGGMAFSVLNHLHYVVPTVAEYQ